MVEVEITGLVITAQYGTLKTGDVLRTTEEFAKHLVEEAKGAKYIKAKKAQPDVVADPPGDVNTLPASLAPVVVSTSAVAGLAKGSRKKANAG